MPFEVQYTVAPVHGFYVYDERMVRVENLTAVLKLTQPSEIAAYTKLFDQFAELGKPCLAQYQAAASKPK